MILTAKDGRWVIDLGAVRDVPKAYADLIHDIAGAAAAALQLYQQSGSVSGKVWVRVALAKGKEPDTSSWHEGHAVRVRKGA